MLLFLVRVGVPRVSEAVRYLDKPQWRAVLADWLPELDSEINTQRLI